MKKTADVAPADAKALADKQLADLPA